MTKTMAQSAMLRSSQEDNNNNKKRARVGPTNNQSRPMATRAANRSRPFAETPDDVVHHIFSFLPVRDAVRNGLVSRHFRDSWRHSRRLVFDRHFFRAARDDGDAIAATIDRVFASHRGDKIQELRLFLDHTLIEPSAVHSWLRRAAAKGLEELDLNFFAAPLAYVFADDFLDVETLRKVHLVHCEIQSPMALSDVGLRNLASLVLRRVVLKKGVIEQVVEHCRSLESLDVGVCYGFQSLHVKAGGQRARLRSLRIGGCPDLKSVAVDAPWLKSFFYEGQCKVLSLEEPGCAPRLHEAFLGFTPTKAYTLCYKRVESFVATCLPSASVLTVSNLFLENLSPRIRNSVYRGFPCTLPNLREFHLFMVGPSFCNLFDIVSFISNCPALTKLYIDMNDFKFELGRYWEIHLQDGMDIFKGCFENLKYIKLLGFKFDRHEMYIMRYLLRKSPNLKTLTLVSPKNGKHPFKPSDLKLLGRLFKTWKCSANAYICVTDYWKDVTCMPKHSKKWY